MDIFGTAATAAHLAAELTLYCIAVKHASSDAEKLRNEMSLISVLLKSLTDLLQESYRHEARYVGWNEVAGTLNIVEINAIKAFGQELEEFSKRVEASETRGLRRLIWPFKDTENIAMIDKISRFKQTITLALGAELL
jgi:hypothetical protein